MITIGQLSGINKKSLAMYTARDLLLRICMI